MAVGTLPPELFEEQQRLNRQQQMAQMLMQQSTQQPQGQMVSGQYVRPSIFAQLAPLAQLYAGKSLAEQGDKQALDLAKQLRSRYGEELNQYQNMMNPKPTLAPEQAGPTQTGAPIPREMMQGTPDRQAANMFAATAYNPALQSIGMKRLTEGPIKLGAEESLLDPNTYQPIAKGPDKVSNDYRDYQQAIKDPIQPFKGSFVDYQNMSNRSKAPITNVSVNAANKFAGGFGEKASAGAYDLYQSALSAPQQIENAKRTIELVNGGALTGPAANVALEAAKIFNVAGANNQDTITKTEQLFSNRGKAMLGSVKQSGLAGSQGLTEGERKFLTQAEGGTITLNPETLKAMAGLEIKMAVANQKKWNQQASKMDKDILNATGAGPVEVYTGIGTVDTSNPLLAPRR
jgi:hypothetical protein